MPLYDFSTIDYYNNAYRGTNGYRRDVKNHIWYPEDALLLKDALNIKTNETILLVGAGFGWIAEEWTNMGLGPICATDTSAWIQANTYTETAPNVTIHNLNVNINTDRDMIKSTVNLGPNDKFKWGITEDLLSCLTDQECIEISNNMKLIVDTVVHLVAIPRRLNDPEWIPKFPHNWKSKEDWKSLLPNDTMVHFPPMIVF